MNNNNSQRNNIIARLIEARTELGITQEELANRIGSKKSAISRIENGQQNLTIDMLIKISNALGKKVDFELNDSESDTVYELRLYNNVLMRFILRQEPLEGLACEIVWIDKNKSNLLAVVLLREVSSKECNSRLAVHTKDRSSRHK